MSSNIRIQRVCEYCEEVFVAKTTVTKYCGDSCAKKAYKARKKAEKIKQSNTQTKTTLLQPLMELQAKEYLTINETCTLLGISRTTLWRVIKRGDLPTAKLGRRVIIRKEDLNKLFK